MREKYVDESYGSWFEHGGEINSTELHMEPFDPNDIGTIINAHNKVQRRLVETVMAFAKADPDAFTAFWYPAKNPGAAG